MPDVNRVLDHMQQFSEVSDNTISCVHDSERNFPRSKLIFVQIMGTHGHTTCRWGNLILTA